MKWCALSERCRAYRLLADRVLDDSDGKHLRISFSATQWIHMLLDIAQWRNSRSVGWRSDYEGHWSKEATKEFKILFIGIVYKATWKDMKKKAFVWLLCLPTFLHLRNQWAWDQKSINRWNWWKLICNEKKHLFFYMLWQYKLDKNFNVSFQENRSLLFSMTAKICFKMLMKSLGYHFPSTEFSIRIDKHWIWFDFTTSLKVPESAGKWFWIA